MRTTNVNPSQGNQGRPLRAVLTWVFLIPVVFGVLLCCGQLAIIFQGGVKSVSPLSRLSADYRAWTEKYQVPRVNAAGLIQDVNKEAALYGTPVASVPGDGQIAPPGEIWKEPTATPRVVAEIPTATKTPTFPPPATNTNTPFPRDTNTPTTIPSRTVTLTLTVIPTFTPTPTRTFVWIPPTLTPTKQEPPPPPQPSGTPTVTPTRTATVPSPTPTVTATFTITPTFTATKAPTFTATFSPTPTDTPTTTPTPTETATITETPTPTSTFTETSTPTITATLAAVHPVAENGGVSEKYDATSCVAYFGYKNDNSVAVTIPIDTAQSNQVIGSGIIFINQPTVFEPDRQYGAFWVIWNAPGTTITWWLQGKAVTANWCNP